MVPTFKKLTILFLCFFCLTLGFLSASPKVLDFSCVLQKEKTIPVSLDWNVLKMVDSSSGYDNELAKAAVVLSREIYVTEESLKKTIESLGYSKIALTEEEDEVSKPAAAFAHQAKNGTNYYLIVVRGTASFADVLTDLKASSDFFEKAEQNTFDAFEAYLEQEMQKSLEEAKKEKNRFFVVGHSMGAAVANLLSRDLMAYAEKNHIFTYTFESPSTGVPVEEATLTNAINIINLNDFVPSIPFPVGRYGEDVYFLPEELDPMLYEEIAGQELLAIVGFTILNKWDNHILDTSLSYVLSRDRGLLVPLEEEH